MTSGPVRILVVEDDPATAGELRHFLESWGYAVADVLSTGEEAVELSKSLEPDLILMDIDLAGRLDGVEAARRIREELDVPVVYVTSFGDSRTVARATATAPYGYVLKPLEPTDLRSSIEVTMHRHRTEGLLRERELWLAATLRCLGEAVIATDADWRVRFLSREAERLVGWQASEAIGRELADVVRVILPPGAKPAWLRGGGAVEGILERRGGSQVPIEERSTLIREKTGRVIGIVVALRTPELDRTTAVV